MSADVEVRTNRKYTVLILMNKLRCKTQAVVFNKTNIKTKFNEIFEFLFLSYEDIWRQLVQIGN